MASRYGPDGVPFADPASSSRPFGSVQAASWSLPPPSPSPPDMIVWGEELVGGHIPEHRILQIFEANAAGQYKTALRLAKSLIAQYPQALILKALVLETMGKPKEALSICLDAKKRLYSNNDIDIDNFILSYLRLVFQRLGHANLATSCYEDACSKYPNDLQILAGLFNCYVNQSLFVKQQQTALKMYKIVVDESFLLNQVCSILSQVVCHTGDERFLSLGESLLKKHISSHSLHHPQAVMIYISILGLQGKYGAAQEILSGTLGSLKGIEVDKLCMQGRFFAYACDYVDAAKRFQKVLELCPDDWDSFIHYLGCLLEDGMKWSKAFPPKKISSPIFVDLETCNSTYWPDDVFESCISSALSFIENLEIDVNIDSIRYRYLVMIQIERRRRLKEKAEDGKLVQVLLYYVYRFSHLFYFTSDMEMFLPILTENEKADLLEKIDRTPEYFSTAPIKELEQAITHFKIQELLGDMFKLSDGDLEETAIRMVEMFCRNLTHSRDFDREKNMHIEDLISMACNVLVQIYSAVSGPSVAFILLSAGFSISICMVLKLVQLEDRMQHSNQLLMARLDDPLLQMKQNADNLKEIESVLESLNCGIQLLELSNEEKLTGLTFNEDLQARPWWSPRSDVNYLSEPFDGESVRLGMNMNKPEAGEREYIAKRIIERKSLLPRLVYLSIQTASSALKGNAEPIDSVSNTNSSYGMVFLLENYAKNMNLTFDSALQVTLEVSRGEKSFKDTGSDAVSLMSFAVFVNAWNLCSHYTGLPNGDSYDSSSWSMIDGLLKICITEQLEVAQPILTSPGSNVPELVQLVTEPLSWHILVAQSYIRSMLPSGKKKKNKNKAGTSEQPNTSQLRVVLSSIQCLTMTVQRVKKWLDDQNVVEDQSMDVLLSHLQRSGDNGPGRVLEILNSTLEADVRISESLQLWDPVQLVRKIAKARHTVLLEFSRICDSKLKLLDSLEKLVQQ